MEDAFPPERCLRLEHPWTRWVPWAPAHASIPPSSAPSTTKPLLAERGGDLFGIDPFLLAAVRAAPTWGCNRVPGPGGRGRTRTGGTGSRGYVRRGTRPPSAGPRSRRPRRSRRVASSGVSILRLVARVTPYSYQMVPCASGRRKPWRADTGVMGGLIFILLILYPDRRALRDRAGRARNRAGTDARSHDRDLDRGSVAPETRGTRHLGPPPADAVEGQMPTNEVTDGALIMFGGALLLTPGLRQRRGRAGPPVPADPRDGEGGARKLFVRWARRRGGAVRGRETGSTKPGVVRDRPRRSDDYDR